MRLVAGCWFAVAGFIPALVSFLVTSWDFHPIGSFVFVGFVIIPIPIFALCGAVIGAPILSESQGRTNYAALRGAAVAALSITLYVLTWAIIETLGSMKPDLGGLVFITLYFMVFWGVVRFVPIIIISAFAGWLLYRCKFAFVIGF
jgi:hypothetical protein